MYSNQWIILYNFQYKTMNTIIERAPSYCSVFIHIFKTLAKHLFLSYAGQDYTLD